MVLENIDLSGSQVLTGVVRRNFEMTFFRQIIFGIQFDRILKKCFKVSFRLEIRTEIEILTTPKLRT